MHCEAVEGEKIYKCIYIYIYIHLYIHIYICKQNSNHVMRVDRVDEKDNNIIARFIIESKKIQYRKSF